MTLNRVILIPEVAQKLGNLPEGTNLVATWLVGYDNASNMRNAHQKRAVGNAASRDKAKAADRQEEPDKSADESADAALSPGQATSICVDIGNNSSEEQLIPVPTRRLRSSPPSSEPGPSLLQPESMFRKTSFHAIITLGILVENLM